MDISRRHFLKVSGGITSGTALGGLAGLGEARTVEACAVCHACLKSIMTLTPTPPAEVAVLDLAMHARVVARERRGVLAWLG